MPTRPANDLTDLGRLSEPALHILISLSDGQKHGYAIATDIEAMTGSRPGPGTLYGAISRLEARQWIEPLGKEGRRRPYQLTAEGGQVLRARVAALDAVNKVAKARLGAAPETA